MGYRLIDTITTDLEGFQQEDPDSYMVEYTMEEAMREEDDNGAEKQTS